jgi:hypothetical protein
MMVECEDVMGRAGTRVARSVVAERSNSELPHGDVSIAQIGNCHKQVDQLLKEAETGECGTAQKLTCPNRQSNHVVLTIAQAEAELCTLCRHACCRAVGAQSRHASFTYEGCRH